MALLTPHDPCFLARGGNLPPLDRGKPLGNHIGQRWTGNQSVCRRNACESPSGKKWFNWIGWTFELWGMCGYVHKVILHLLNAKQSWS